MNAESQKEWTEERRKAEWKAGVVKLRRLIDEMEKDQIKPAAYWNIQLLLNEDLWTIFTYGGIK